MNKFAFLFTALLSIFQMPSFAQAIDTESSFVPQVLCSETCQHWDKFNDVCQYKTACTIEGSLVTTKKCAKWDNFDDVCQNETVSRRYVKFDTSTGSPSCTTSCQFEGPFGDCLYYTSCEVTQTCASLTQCQYWDKFNDVCLSESTEHTCNLKP